MEAIVKEKKISPFASAGAETEAKLAELVEEAIGQLEDGELEITSWGGKVLIGFPSSTDLDENLWRTTLLIILEGLVVQGAQITMEGAAKAWAKAAQKQ